MSDKHVENAIAWCDIRTRNLNKQVRTAVTNGTITREMTRVYDLRRDLEAELRDRRAKRPALDQDAAKQPLHLEAIREGGMYEMTLEVPIDVAGVKYFSAGAKIRFMLPKGKRISLLRTGPLPA